MQGVFVVLGAAVIGFLLLNLAGNPADVLGTGIIGEDERKAIAHELGFDRPLVTRFLDYMVAVVQGDFGESYRTGASALDTLLASFPSTLLLVGCALASAISIAVPLSVFSVLHRESRSDRALRRGLMLAGALPDYWVSLVLVLVFSVSLGVLPSTGLDGGSSLVLPSVAIALPILPALVRLLRGSLLDAMQKDFMTALRGKGFSERRIVWRHGLHHALIPFLTLLGLQVGWLLSGAIVVEVVFAWPGVGSLLVDAVAARDFAIVQAIIVFVAVAYVVVNLLVDLCVLLIDPRARHGAAR